MGNVEYGMPSEGEVRIGVKCEVRSARSGVKHFGRRLAGHRSRLMEMRVLES